MQSSPLNEKTLKTLPGMSADTPGSVISVSGARSVGAVSFSGQGKALRQMKTRAMEGAGKEIKENGQTPQDRSDSKE